MGLTQLRRYTAQMLHVWHDAATTRLQHASAFGTYVVHHSHKSKRTVCAKETKELPQTHKDTQRHWKQNFQASLAIEEEDSEADRPSGMSRKHRIHSRFYWFTEFCNSQCLSHFAAPFISVQAKTFIAEGCNWDIHMGRESHKKPNKDTVREILAEGEEPREMYMREQHSLTHTSPSNSLGSALESFLDIDHI